MVDKLSLFCVLILSKASHVEDLLTIQPTVVPIDDKGVRGVTNRYPYLGTSVVRPDFIILLTLEAIS